MPQKSHPQVRRAYRAMASGYIIQNWQPNQKPCSRKGNRDTQRSKWQSHYKGSKSQHGVDGSDTQNIFTSSLAGEEPISSGRKRKLNRCKCETRKNRTHLLPLWSQQDQSYRHGQSEQQTREKENTHSDRFVKPQKCRSVTLWLGL